jgi:predicted nuclease of predicted toxin-antitoxin system
MRKPGMCFLLDQNVPVATAGWLRGQHPDWSIHHVNELGLQGKSDEFLYQWAQQKPAIVITYDEDFADARCYPLGRHHGVIRLRVWPTTVESTIEALKRLLEQLPLTEWVESLIIIDNQKIRVRRL